MRYWKVAPGSGGSLWSEQRDNECIAVGWNKVGNLKQYNSKIELAKAVRKYYKGSPNQLWTFYTEVTPNNKILANSGGEIYGLGIVKGKYKFNPDLSYKHTKPVYWYRKFWAPIYLDELSLPETLETRLFLNRTILPLLETEWEIIEKQVSEFKSPFEGYRNLFGLMRSPQTEQETIILFSHLCQSLRFRIEYVSTRYPDAYLQQKEDGEWVSKTAEFELYSSSFVNHMKKYRKDPESCDMIICWIHDWDEKPDDLEVIDLKKELENMI